MNNRTSRGRLFRKYVVVLLVLVGGVLMASSLVELYFSYRETQLAIIRVERAKAVAAAARIEQFLKEIELQVRETTRTTSDDPDASQVGAASSGFAKGWARRWPSSASSTSSELFAPSRPSASSAISISRARSSSESLAWTRMSSAARRTSLRRQSSSMPRAARPTGVPSTSRMRPSRT